MQVWMKATKEMMADIEALEALIALKPKALWPRYRQRTIQNLNDALDRIGKDVYGAEEKP